MECREVIRLLDPYSDGELDLVRQVEIEQHLSSCAGCSEQARRLRELRDALSSPSLYRRAPDSLRKKITAPDPPIVDKGSMPPRRSSMRFAVAAGVLLLIATSVTIGSRLPMGRGSAVDRLAERVTAGHIRSLQAEHLTDVASTDRHTVKPWFQGKLDFSPQVPDLSAQGFSLSGGRLDYLVDRPVAALAYLRRAHVVNVFLWPNVDEGDQAVQELSRQGFRIRWWRSGGMSCWVISDLNDQELDEFVRLFQEHSVEVRP